MNYQDIIAAALKELGTAAVKLQKQTVPRTPEPRPRIFQFTADIMWPSREHSSKSALWVYLEHGNNFSHQLYNLTVSYEIFKAASYIVSAHSFRPRRILRVLRRIQDAAIWCEARTEGRKRHAEEILRQRKQSPAVKVLEAEMTMLALK